MKLTRIRLEHVRQFRAPLEIDQLQDGLNIFTGPNESGKSTIARAIRAAFFERYRTKTVDDLLPWGDSSVSPHIELDFEVSGTPHSLSKSFIKSARCSLRVGRTEMDGEAAENHLGTLFGFQFAGRGESKPEHWGIPGLLWIEQGKGHDVTPAVDHAVDHLRSALQKALGELAVSGGDEILEKVGSERNLLLTGTGKPRGAYADSQARRQTLITQIEQLDQRIEQYKRQVDLLETLLAAHKRDEAERPWEALRAKQKQAEEARERLRAVEQSLKRDRERLTQAQGTLRLLQDRLSDREAKERELKQRLSALSELEQRLKEVMADYEALKLRKEAALVALQEARERARWAKDVAERARLLEQGDELKAKKEALESQIAACDDLTKQISALRAKMAGLQVDPRVIEELRIKERDMRENAIRQEAAATRLEFDLLPGVALTLEGEEIEGRAKRRVIQSSDIRIPAVGHIRVVPGGGDLEALGLAQRELEASIRSLLTRLGVNDSNEAEERFVAQQKLQTQWKEHERDLANLAPKGVEELRASLVECLARLGAIEDTLSRIPEPPESATALSMEEAERRLDQAQKFYDEVSAHVQQAEISKASCLAELEAAQKEAQQLESLLSDPDETRRHREASVRLVDTKAEIDVLSAQIDRQQSELVQARPDILDQDIDRYRKSADVALTQHEKSKLDIARLQAQLQEAGAQGLEEQRGELSMQLEEEERRLGELERRARALDLLKTLLEGKRHALTKRLQAPLQKHLNNYLQLLLPGASIEINDDLTPGSLQRGNATSRFDELSFGAREQMGLISRLAYADLLREAGQPTFILLDDVLVHSDQGRLQAMKRVITDAATRHQILLFTCHPEDWGDMGVELRSLDQLKPPSAVASIMA